MEVKKDRTDGSTRIESETFSSGQLFQMITDNYPNSYLWIINRDLTIDFISGQEFKTKNLDPKQFMGLSLEKFFLAQTSSVKKHIQKSFKGAETTFELDFNDQCLSFKTVPLHGEKRKIDQILVVAENVTERKQAAADLLRSEERYRTLFETMAQGVVYQDADGQIISANPAATEILGLSLKQMQGRTSTDPRWKAIREDGSPFPGEEHPAIVALKTGKPVRNIVMGIFHPRKEAYCWININAMPQYRNGEDKPYQVYTTFEDITERKQAEKALIQREITLGERIKELNCIFDISALIENPQNSLSEILQGTVDIIPPAWQYPEITCARVVVGRQVFTSEKFRESKWRLESKIISRGELLGKLEVFYLEKRPSVDEGPFLKEERELANEIAARLARIIEQIRVQDDLLIMARTDSLTGLLNRRYFFELARKELERARRYDHDLSCLMFDIDTFKQINDQYGHMVGDQMLMVITAKCKEIVREYDILARYGGDEFVILLPETSTEEAGQAAERLRQSLEKDPVEADSEELHFSVSVGVAGIPGKEAVSLNELLARADRALYQSKKNGRNRVTVWQQPD